MNQACADKGGRLQIKYCILKKSFIFHLDYISSYWSIKNNVERDWVGSTVHTSYKLGRCRHTEEDQEGLRTSQLPLHRFTTIVLASHKDIILHSSQTSVTLFILSQCSSITYRCNAAHWHSTRDIGVHLGQGAQGPPPGPQGPRGPSQHYTPPMVDILQEH